jgi:ADP-heptose:LPS heptosyltransferase
MIEGADFNLIGKTNFLESAAILAHAALHIDGESGLVHLRHMLGKRKSVVLFGPTPVAYFSYPENVNMISENCHDCMWMIDEWNEFCSRGRNAVPECLKSITPNCVLSALPSDIFITTPKPALGIDYARE